MCFARRFLLGIVVTLTVAGVAAQQGEPADPAGQGGGRGVGGGRGGGGRGLGQLQRPPRDNQARPAGTARIRGRVGSAESGAPIRRAQVRLTSPEMRLAKVVVTGSDGSFEFAELPAGSYTMSVSKTGYVTWQYGQRRPFEPGKRIELSEGQAMDGATVALPRGGVITGRIVDELGEPVSEVTVQAIRFQYVAGRRQLVPAGRIAQTDDIGQFRVFGLTPGDYFIAASLRNSAQVFQLSADAQGWLQGQGTVEVGAVASPVIGALAERLQQFGGPLPEDSSGYAPTYYPGTPNVTDAQRITVGAGEEVPGISFSLTAVRLSRVSGTAVDSAGMPLTRATVTMRPRSGPTLLSGNAQNASVAFGGNFAIAGVPPGDYVLQVRAPAPSRTEIEFASVPVTVSGSDIDGLAVATSKGASVTGHVTFGRDAAPANAAAVQVAALSTEADQLPLGPAAQGGRFASDGTFALSGLSGPTLFRVNPPPAGWMLKAVRLGGVDITDTPYEFKPGESVAGLEVELTNKLTQIDGTITNSRGQPVSEYAIVVFAASRDRWGFQTRFVRAGRSDQDGRFQIKGLPPGRYLAAAVDYLEQGSESNPDLLDMLSAGATRVTLDEGETLPLNLKLPL